MQQVKIGLCDKKNYYVTQNSKVFKEEVKYVIVTRVYVNPSPLAVTVSEIKCPKLVVV